MSNVMPAAFSVSSFGAEQTTWGANSTFRGRYLIDSPRYKELDRRQSYYDCTQHDYKQYDFDGRIISTTGAAGAGYGATVTQPLLSSERASFFVPLKARRPSSPYRLARVVVNAFTSLLFGENRFPHMRAEADLGTQDYAQTLAKMSGLPVKMIRARNMGGATGTACLSWCFLNGKPRIEVHNSKHAFVHEWADREALIPRHVTEAYLYPKDKWDPQKRTFVRQLYWYRRDWTPNEDILFNEVAFDPARDPADSWQPDMGRSVAHNDGVTHFEWIQNLPSEDMDGLPDYDGLYESFDAIDLVLSVITRGAALNLDPTLLLRMDPDQLNRAGVRKGSDNALIVGEGGDASYLELSGQSIEAGLKLFQEKRRTTLEVAQCILPDSSEIAAQGVSAVALRTIYAPMLAKADVLREQYGVGMKRVLENMLAVARDAKAGKTQVFINAKGEQEELPVEVKLPPRVTQEPANDKDVAADGAPPEPRLRLTPRDPGTAEHLALEWGAYFYPTPTDQQAIVTTMTLAVANQPVMSQQTAVELTARFLGRDPTSEWSKVQHAQASLEKKQADMMGDASGATGGKVTQEHELPGGAKIKTTQAGPPHPSPNADDDSEESPPPPPPANP